MSRVRYGDVDLDGVSVARRARARPDSNGWGERAVRRGGDDDGSASASERESQYTDADSVASDAFESGAEDISDDEQQSGARRRSGDAASRLAEDVANVRLGASDDRSAPPPRGEPPGAPEFSEAEVREAFAAFDEDGDGLLDHLDVQSFFDALGESLTAHEARALVDMVDADEDGKVDFEEFFELATRSAKFLDDPSE